MDKKLLGLSTVFILVSLVVTGYIFFSGSFNINTRASNTNNTPSAQDSLIFAWPLTVAADGTSTSEVTIFIRNASGKGLDGKIVKLSSSLGNLDQEEATTDEEGKAIFSLASNTQGVAELSAMVDNESLLRKITVKFE